jgi:hypothetical protein
MRDPDRMVDEAQRLGADVGRFMAQLLAGPVPWAHLRQAQRLLRLGNKYGRPRLEAACHRALHFDLIHVSRVERILQRGLDAASAPRPAGQLVLLPPARFMRPAGSFTHAPTRQETGDGN